jgi:hypothetical protein
MNTIRKTIIGASVLGATLGGVALGALSVGSASAQTASTTATTAAPAAGAATTALPSATPPTGPQQGARDPSKGGHVANGITEVVLTGDDATKATAAANAAVPGATIDRVETDAEGATYEAHVTKADGSKVTVKFNADFSVKSIDSGMS